MDPLTPVPELPRPASAPGGGLAIASFVCGVLAVLLGLVLIGGLFGLAGLILGLAACATRRPRRAFAGWGIGLSVAGIVLACGMGLVAGYWYLMSDTGSEVQEKHARPFRPADWIGRPMPELTLTALDGRTIRSADWKGHRAVVGVWASWHPGCAAAVPDFVRLARETADRGVQIVAVTFEDAADVTAFVRERELNYPIVATNDLPAPLGRVESVPTTFFIDETGAIRDIRVGYDGYGALKQAALGEATRNGEGGP